MGKRKKAVTNAPAVAERQDNGLGGALTQPGVGIGGGINEIFPFTASQQISQADTIFRNLRWYLVSNFRQVLSEAYVELGLVQTVVDVPVDDGLRGGVEFKSKQLSEEQIEELQASMDRDDDLTVAGQAAKWNRLYGGAGILILTDQDPEEPLDIEMIGPDTPLEFRAVDMWELFWDKQNSEGYDPAIQSQDFEYYSYYGEQVHKSRVMRLKGMTAPSFIRPRLRGWGFSVVEILVRSINQYLKATDLGFEVLDEFKLDVYKIKNLVNTLLSPNGQQKIQQRVQLANWQKNYQHAVVMDSEDDFDHKQLSFSGLAEAMGGIRMQVASDTRFPLTKLFGISAAGFNSGEDDIEVYNAMVEGQVRNKIKYDILRIGEIRCQKLFGFIPDDLQLSFKPLRVLSAKEEEEVKTQKFTRAIQAQQAGLITAEEFRDECNRAKLLTITLEEDVILPEPDLEGEATDEGQNPKKETDIDDPGANRIDTQKARAGERGSAPKEPSYKRSKPAGKPAPRSADAPGAKAKIAKKNSDDWDEEDHPRDEDGQFAVTGASAGEADDSSFDIKPHGSKIRGPSAEELPRAKGKVDGRKIMDEIPNEGSIGSSLDDYEVVKGLREISMDFFSFSPPHSKSEMDRTKDLAARIKKSGEIAPLIVVEDAEGYYILEGGHRFDALNMIGAKSFPALVVRDLSSLESESA